MCESRLRRKSFPPSMEEKAKSGRSMTRSWFTKPWSLPGGGNHVEKSPSRKLQLFFRGLNFGHVSKSLLMLSGFQTASPNLESAGSSSSTMSGTSEESFPEANVCNSPPESSAASEFPSTNSWSLSRSSSVPSSTSFRHSFLTKRSSSGRHRGMEGRKAVLLEKVPFGKSDKYLTVYIGVRTEQCVKYVVRRSLLKHPLFQLLLKCSEDEFGDEYTVNKGVAISCDPELFIKVVRAVDDSLWALGNDGGKVDSPQVRN